jgi:hypothetical protein
MTCGSPMPRLRAPPRNSENSKANRIETMKGPTESGQICSVGRRKIAKKIAKNKRCLVSGGAEYQWGPRLALRAGIAWIAGLIDLS